jgi:hypothetical protein
MTAKERIFAAVARRHIDRTPTISWPKQDTNADVQVYPATAIAKRPQRFDVPALAQMPNLFRHFELLGEDPVAIMKATDQRTCERVELAESENRSAARLAIENGALGLLYEVHGADASRCTPMEYGGLFLERDRALLESVSDAPCNFVYINGKEPYLDFVADLPAQGFAWDLKGSGISVEEVRKIRKGTLVAADPSADIPLAEDGSITEGLEVVTSNV